MSTPVYKFALREDLKDNKEFLPTRAHDTDTGYDVRASQQDRNPLVIKPFEYVKIPLGFRALCPSGWWYKLVPRSSTFGKKSLHALYGTVDETYEGELVFAAQYIPHIVLNDQRANNDWAVAMHWTMKEDLTINFGDAIGQIIPVKRQEMEAVMVSNEELDAAYKERNGVRGEGGFGSTGV